MDKKTEKLLKKQIMDEEFNRERFYLNKMECAILSLPVAVAYLGGIAFTYRTGMDISLGNTMLGASIVFVAQLNILAWVETFINNEKSKSILAYRLRLEEMGKEIGNGRIE